MTEESRSTGVGGQLSIDDNPILGEAQDELDMKARARSLVEVVRSAPMPFTIALQGEWGSGKSSLINLMGELLREEVDEKFHVINVDAWRCALATSTADETAAGVVEAIKSRVEHIKWEKSEKNWKEFVLDPLRVFHRHNQLYREKLRKLTKKLLEGQARSETNEKSCCLWCGIIGAFMYLIFIPLVTWLFELLALIWTVIVEMKCPKWMKDISGREKGAALLLKALGGLGDREASEFRQKMEDDIEKIIGKKGGEVKRGVVIFVDNLDRLDPQHAVKVLDIIKNLLIINHCVFVLAIDFSVVEKGLASKFDNQGADGKSGDQSADAQRKDLLYRSYFDKIVQLPFYMPVARYSVDTLLANALSETGYFNKNELNKSLEPRQQEILAALPNVESNQARRDLLVGMLQLSTGKNPRSIKRLAYLLLLYRLAYEKNCESNEEKKLTPGERCLCFGLVCVQLAYANLYKELLNKPDFTKCEQGDWKEQIKIDGYRNDDALVLLELMSLCVPGGKLGSAMRKLLDLAEEAGGKAAESENGRKEREDFFRYLQGASIQQESIRRLERFTKKLHQLFRDDEGESLLRTEYTEKMMYVYAVKGAGDPFAWWLVKEPENNLCYNMASQSGSAVLKPMDIRRATEIIWKNLLMAYNMKVPEKDKLSDDFVKERWEKLWPPAAERGAAS